ncbi:MAG: twin-arginine translocase TatA/TatE family subunit [Myxococcota bacterium]
MFGIGPMELVLILVVALLVLGPKRMPELARTLGKGLGEFRRASSELRQSLALDEIQNELREGLTGAGTLHKPIKRPEADDKPAQAGDDLPDGPDPAEASGSAATSEEAASARHPGELPDDLDPHAHADDGYASGDAYASGDGQASGDPTASGDAPRTDGAARSASGTSAEGPEPPSPSAADDDLGTVPVGKVTRPRRTVGTGPPPPAQPTPDDERG